MKVRYIYFVSTLLYIYIYIYYNIYIYNNIYIYIIKWTQNIYIIVDTKYI